MSIADLRKCPICRKVMPMQSIVQPEFSIIAYYRGGRSNTRADTIGGKDIVVCSKACLVTLMERRAKQVLKGKPTQLLVGVHTTDAPEMLGSFARQLRCIRD